MAFMIDGAERELGATRQRGGDEQHQHEFFHIVAAATTNTRLIHSPEHASRTPRQDYPKG